MPHLYKNLIKIKIVTNFLRKCTIINVIKYNKCELLLFLVFRAKALLNKSN